MQKDNSWSPSTCIYENDKYSVIEDSVFKCDEMINVTNSVSTNVTSTVSNVFDNKKVKCKLDCYRVWTVSFEIVLLFIIAIIRNPFAKHRSKQKKVLLN